MRHSEPEKRFALLTLDTHKETGPEVHENCIEDFSEKVLIHGKWAILGQKMKHPPCNSELALKIVFKCCTMKWVKR